jgi:thioredoxin reductase (NADPH)
VSRARQPRAFRPVILAVDDDPGGLERIERELRKRYAADYEIACEGSAEAGLERLRDLRTSGEEVAVVLASQLMSEMTGVDFLTRANQVFPTPGGWRLPTWATAPRRRASPRRWCWDG